MGKIWVHIEVAFAPEGDEAKAAMTQTLKSTLTKSVTDKITAALPADKFSASIADKPTAVSQAYNAIKIVATLNLKVETQGSQMTVTGTLKTQFEAIKAPSTLNGNLLISGSKGASSQRRGSGEFGVTNGTNEVLDAVVGLLIKQMITNPTFISYGKKMGLPLS